MKKNKKNIVKQEIKEKQEKSSKYISFYHRLILKGIFVLIFMFLTIFFFYKTLVTQTVYDLNYVENSSSTYRVKIVPNEFYDSEYLGEDRNYITSLIDQIEVDYKYDLSVSEISDLNLNYYVIANLTITEKNNPNKLLYEKTDFLIENNDISKEDINKSDLTESVLVDYNKYNDYVNSFKSNYSLQIDSNLSVTLYVVGDIKYSKFKDSISINNRLSVNIPLEKQTIEITKTEGKTNEVVEFKEKSNREVINIVYLILSVISLICSLIFVIKFIRYLNYSRTKKSLYTKKVEKILKEHDRIVVETTKLLDLNEYKKIEISSFNELLDVRDNLGKPILYLEIHKNSKGWFYIIDNDTVYLYVLKDVDILNGDK